MRSKAFAPEGVTGGAKNLWFFGKPRPTGQRDEGVLINRKSPTSIGDAVHGVPHIDVVIGSTEDGDPYVLTHGISKGFLFRGGYTHMEAMEAILKRKSVRSYKQEAPTDEQLKALADAGLSGPGGGAVHLSVVQKADLIKRINDITKAAMLASEGFAKERASLPGYEPLYGAPVLMLFSAPDQNGLANCACAAENVLIAATGLGLGSCFLMSIKSAFSGSEGPELLKQCGVPEGYTVCCGVIAGIGDGDKFSSANRKVRTVNYVK